MCDITPYGVIGHTENTRLMDVVEDMSREDWWVRPWKAMSTQATTVTVPPATNVVSKTDTGILELRGILGDLVSSNSNQSTH